MLRALALLSLLTAGCTGSGAKPVDAGADTFIAFATSFQGFRSWTAYHSDGPAPGTVTPDVLGSRTQYINKVPQHRGDAFPVGTIIVEARETGSQLIFAGVKRGGGFNADGAKDWEWFELQEEPGGAVSIVWRGFGPPEGSSMYGGSNRCNTCHAGCADNDYTCSPKLRLADF